MPDVVDCTRPARMSLGAIAPKLVLAVAASLAPVPPSATVRSVMPVIEPPVIETLLAAWVDIVPKPWTLVPVAAAWSDISTPSTVPVIAKLLFDTMPKLSVAAAVTPVFT